MLVSPGDSEAKPLIFTFVPTVRRLPTHIQVADTSKFLVKIPEESRDKSPESVNRFEYSDHMTFSCESKQEKDQRLLASATEGSGRNSQGKKLDTNNPLGMQKGDLFKAEYVFIVDSDGEDEATSRQSEQGPAGGVGNIATRPKSLAISSSLASDVVRPKVREADLKTSSHPEIPHAMAPQQKHGQTPTTHPRAAGRETKYANLLSTSSTASEGQLTKPGVIRPVPVKSKLLLRKEEEVYEPNPFSKYLEDNSDLFSEQLGIFSVKPDHPMVAIPEHDILDSKE